MKARFRIVSDDIVCEDIPDNLTSEDEITEYLINLYREFMKNPTYELPLFVSSMIGPE